MARIMALLPTAMICVDVREENEYLAAGVPRDKLLVHPESEGLAAAYNWLLHTVKTPILIEVDDDFVGVKSLVGSSRSITNPEEILQILLNAAQACSDLGLGAFCFSRSANPAMVKPDFAPIKPVMPVCNAFGVMNAARYRLYDSSYLGRGDVDHTLRTLKEDRCVYSDARFYFDCGRVFSGRGGNVGLVTESMFKQTSDALAKKWGKYVSYKLPNFAKAQGRSVAAIRVNVSRTNPVAQK